MLPGWLHRPGVALPYTAIRPASLQAMPGHLSHGDRMGVMSMSLLNRPGFKSQLCPFAQDGRKQNTILNQNLQCSHEPLPLLKALLPRHLPQDSSFSVLGA